MMQRGCGRMLLLSAVSVAALTTSGCSFLASEFIDSDEPAATLSEAGDPGTWELLNAADITPESTVLRLGVTRMACASGETGAVLEPEVQVEAKRIVIRTPVEEQEPGAYRCPSNNVVPVTVELEAPIGERDLVDAACLDEANLVTAFCIDSGVRWHP
jgi:hypothetical protein